MKKRRKRYKIRQDRFIPFMLFLVLIIVVLSLIAKCTGGGKGPAGGKVAGGIWASGLIFDENSEAAEVKRQQLEEYAHPRKIASPLAEDTYLVQSNAMKRIPQPIRPRKHNPLVDCFENSVFVGNSCLEGLRNYGLIDGAVYLTKVGLNVNSAYEKSRSGSNVPIMEELWGEPQYAHVYLMFGENELGWADPAVFIESYGRLIDDVRERQPGAEIFVQSILPVSQAASDRNLYNVNNQRIEEFNALIRELCREKRVMYLDVASSVKNENGCLPDGASVDGVHPNKEYCQIWVDYIRSVL